MDVVRRPKRQRYPVRQAAQPRAELCRFPVHGYEAYAASSVMGCTRSAITAPDPPEVVNGDDPGDTFGRAMTPFVRRIDYVI